MWRPSDRAASRLYTPAIGSNPTQGADDSELSSTTVRFRGCHLARPLSVPEAACMYACTDDAANIQWRIGKLQKDSCQAARSARHRIRRGAPLRHVASRHAAASIRLQQQHRCLNNVGSLRLKAMSHCFVVQRWRGSRGQRCFAACPD